ncbi:MAG TPA: EthD family reductase [Stellaceae bacterium]|nr:EthD family reductase [Stellaceae bacterium]
MIKISVLYPYKEGEAFDMNYYLHKHMPMVRDTIGAACKGIAVEQGLSGGMPGSHPPFVAAGHILLESAAALPTAFAPHVPKFLADIPNYTKIEPVIQISEVKA